MSGNIKNKKSLIYLNGVEITPNLLFTGWKAGFEYTKNLYFKNLNTKTVKLAYTVPKTKTFTTLFPKQISLSPGTTFCLPITFRPLNKVDYADDLELIQLDFDKTFVIKLIAKLPEFKLEFQDSIDLGATCVNESVSAEVKINNKSELDTYFEWDVNEPFSVSPINGEIKANSSMNVVFSFRPEAALVFEANVVCKYGSDSTTSLYKTIKLNAIGKYPHLLIENGYEASSEVSLKFDKVYIGQNQTKYFTIINMTGVNTSYTVERNQDIPIFDRCFNCLQYMGCLKPYERQKIPISYSPNYPSKDEVFDYFTIFTAGKTSKSVVTCIATNDVAKVTIEHSLISFGLCLLNNKILKTFNLKNHSQCPVEFQFETDNESSCFKLNQIIGVLQPNETKLFQILFIPQHPIIYYKKITCILNNHNPLFIELTGTCHSETMKPAEINKKHIDQYYALKKHGFLSNSPEQLAENQSVQLRNVLKNLSDSSKHNELENYDEYLSNHEDSLIQIDSVYVDFGASLTIQSLDQQVQEKSISIFNQTKSKIVLYWNSSEKQPFKISPQICEIPAMKSCSFRIKFEPEIPDQFYKCKLEGYALYKSLTDYTLTEPKFILPPWCLNIDCLGHTFHPSSETYFLPKCSIDAENVIFPVSVKDKPIYRNLILKNNSSDTPLMFDFKNLATSEFNVKPLKGMIKKNEHQIFLMKFTPKMDSYTVEKIEIALNYMNKHTLEIGLVGGGVSPLVSLENNGLLYFPPTCKNNNSFQLYEVTNLTRNTLNYEWKIPFEAKHLFSVDEPKSVLLPYEKKKFIWRFSPEKLEKFNQKMTLVTWIEDNKQNYRTYSLRILGSCSSGSLQGLEMYKDFGNVIVGSSISSEIVLINNNDCNLDFELFLKQTTDEVNKSFNNICVLELEKMTGHVQARSRCAIRCRLRPTKLISYQFTIEYKILYPNEVKNEANSNEDTSDPLNRNIIEEIEAKNDSFNNLNKKEILCYMTANGVYPKLSITDIKAMGVASNLSKDFLWKLLSIKELNTSMSCEPNPEELIYSIATRQEANRRLTSQNTKHAIELNFNAAPLNSDDTQVILFVENSGLVATDWVLLFPKDLLLELEYWAQNGEYEIEELEQMKIQDNKLFSIEPKKGHLEPGEMIRIKIVYKHLFTGQNKLPVLLKIAKGREIMLNLVGTTVPRNEPFIFFPSTKFEFEPVEIGLQEYPIQIYELFNGGDVTAEVEIDYSYINELNQENYSRPVLKCLTENEISIAPGSVYETKWKFSPIEAKTYQVDIVFKVNKVHFNAVTFKCIGYDKRKMNNTIIGNRIREIPEKQIFTLPNQLALLSMDRIVLGDIPLFTRERKMIFVKNNSSDHKISFTWHVTNPDHIRYIRIQPSRGIVDINQNKLCKLTFISKDKPAFFNIDLICEIKNETEMDVYRNELELWKNEQTRQFQEFVIEETELENRLKGFGKKEDAKEANKTRDKNVGSQLAVHKFKTIPPILRNNNLEESNVEKVRRRREEKKQWIKPLPPSPFLLHLNIIARSQHADEFLESSKKVKTNSEKFIDPLLGYGANKNLIEQNNPDKKSLHKIFCTEEESEAVSFIFSDLLRNLVSDKSFHSLVNRIKDEDVPYFFQFSPDDGYSLNSESPSTLDKLSSNKSNEKSNQSTSSKKKSIQSIKTSPIFCSLIENILENTISNILTEAFNKEFSLTSRPRLIALPPKLNNNGLADPINQHDTNSKSNSFGINKSNSNLNKSSFFSKSKTGETIPLISPIMSLSELV